MTMKGAKSQKMAAHDKTAYQKMARHEKKSGDYTIIGAKHQKMGCPFGRFGFEINCQVTSVFGLPVPKLR